MMFQSPMKELTSLKEKQNKISSINKSITNRNYIIIIILILTTIISFIALHRQKTSD